MDFSSTPVEKLIEYQWALANALELINQQPIDLHQTKESLIELNEKITAALKDEQFEINKLKEL